MNTYGYLYNDPIDPSYPTQNLIVSNDGSGSNGQFRIVVGLSYGSSYVLLVTTSDASGTGDFSVSASGPSSIGLSAFNPSTSRPVGPTSESLEVRNTRENKDCKMNWLQR